MATDRFGAEAQPTAKVSGSASQSNVLSIASLCPALAAPAYLATFEVLSLLMELVDIMFSYLMFILFWQKSGPLSSGTHFCLCHALSVGRARCATAWPGPRIELEAVVPGKVATVLPATSAVGNSDWHELEIDEPRGSSGANPGSSLALQDARFSHNASAGCAAAERSRQVHSLGNAGRGVRVGSLRGTALAKLPLRLEPILSRVTFGAALLLIQFIGSLGDPRCDVERCLGRCLGFGGIKNPIGE